MQYTDEELLACLRRLADALGETPTQRQCRNAETMPSVQTYCDRFGSWNDALEAAGLDVNVELLSDDELLTILQEFAAELGETPTRKQCNEAETTPCAKTYRNKFGSWNTALEQAGLDTNHYFERYDGTDEELLEMLRELAAELDTSPTQDDVDFAPDLPNSGVFERRFGGWNAAKRQAGLSTHDNPNWYTDAELIQELQRVAHEQENSPTKAEINNADAPSPSTYVRRFDSWTAALEQAGLAETHQPPTQ